MPQPATNLFQLGNFQLHSGERSRWKIECDALTDNDLEAIALMIVEQVPAPFGHVHGIPRGGLRLAKELIQYTTTDAAPVLVVDDVLTTGASMEEARRRFNDDGRDVFGAVIFARGPCPDWIMPVFAMPQP